MRSLSAILLLAACSGSDDPSDPSATKTDGTDTSDTNTVETTDTVLTTATGDTGEDVVCVNGITNRFPVNGTTDAFFGTNVEFYLNSVEEDAYITLDGPAGPVAGTSSVVGKRVRFTPDAFLDPETSYTATLDWSCPDETTTFTTSRTGEAVDITAIDGAAYRLDLVNGRWIQPSGLGPLIGPLLGADILIGVEVNGTDLDLTFARTDDFGEPQDLCEPTTAFPTASFANNPLFAVGPADVELQVDGEPLPVYELELTGAFSVDADRLDGGRIAGLADMQGLSQTLGNPKDPESICPILAKFSVTCQACPEGGPETCVRIEVDSVRGTVETESVVPRSITDIANDPACN